MSAPTHAPQGLVHDRHMCVHFASFDPFCTYALVARWQQDINGGRNCKQCF
jgi:hypothetical protein